MAEPSLTIAFVGDTMLGRAVAEPLETGRTLVDREVAAIAAEADLLVANLECCISARGAKRQAAGKRFHFRAPPRAAEFLAELGVDAVTLANNHALDFGALALLDTFEHLDAAGIRHFGAGPDRETAQAPLLLEAGGMRLALVGVCDHEVDSAAGIGRPGIAYADLEQGRLPDWLGAAIAGGRRQVDAVIVCPHWGPNMVERPVGWVRRSAAALCEAGATLVAGHSAHVPHGAAGPILYDLGDFLDDYAVNQRLRNDLGLLFRIALSGHGPSRIEAFPLKLDFCHTRLAAGEEAAWVMGRFASACAELGMPATVEPDRVTSLG